MSCGVGPIAFTVTQFIGVGSVAIAYTIDYAMLGGHFARSISTLLYKTCRRYQPWHYEEEAIR